MAKAKKDVTPAGVVLSQEQVDDLRFLVKECLQGVSDGKFTIRRYGSEREYNSPGANMVARQAEHKRPLHALLEVLK